MLVSLLPLLLLFLEATASSLTITIPPSNLLPHLHTLPASTHATLTSIPHANQPGKSVLTAPLTRSLTFVFRNLQPSSAQPQSFLLDIRSSEYVFSPYRVDVSADGNVVGVWETFRGNPWDNRGSEKFLADAAVQASSESSADVTVPVKLVARKGFYEERAKFSPLGLFKNPMILFAVVALAFTLGMPKLMQNMDPELRAEFEKHSRTSPISGATRNAMQGGGGGPGNFDLAGWMAGASPGPIASAEAASEGAATERESGGATRRRG